MIFRQLFDRASSTFTYIIASEKTKEAIVIDPVFEQIERDSKFITQFGLSVTYIVDTHIHADHITGSYHLQQKVGGKIGVGVKNDFVENNNLFLSDSDILKIGELEMRVFETPGHTSGCITLLVGDKLFTGDLLFVRGSGRTDFQEGSNKEMFRSVREKIFRLSDNIHIYPGHDYNGCFSSSVGEEKEYNPRLNMSHSYEQFENIMNNLHLAYPKKIEINLLANKNCGKLD
ncbi:MBL fold metallo-hydrolase [Candidatus Gracilibacteria bacterium 28_42_T64]|nr:MBL fold metallo-hydrolase [Candidatus Gracilibacteria bacterium 28_42_T64]